MRLHQFPQHLLRLLPSDRVASLWGRGWRLIDERLQRRDYRPAADPLQRERGEPPNLLVLIAQGGDQLADRFRRALLAQGEQRLRRWLRLLGGGVGR